MWLLGLLALVSSAQGTGLLNDLLRSHPISSTSRYDFNYPAVKYEIYSTPKPQIVGSFWGMPPPLDSPYMASMPTHPPIVVAKEFTRLPALRDEDWRFGTTEHYGTEGYPSPYPTRRFSTSWGDKPGTRSTSGEETSFKSSEEEDGWGTFSIFGKGSQPKTKLSKKWCDRYKTKCKSTNYVPNGILTRITGGQPAKPREHPYMVMIGYGKKSSREWLCGGSLVSSNFVLSAAHCVNTAKIGPARWALLGDLDISTTADDARPQEREIVQRIVHPDYKEPAVYHDLALFKLDRDVTFTSWVSPICLHSEKTEPSGGGTITGWGRTNFVSETSPVLMEVDVTIFNSSFCKETVDKVAGAKMSKGYDPATMICAGDVRGGKDACQGDSGGPLVIGSGECGRIQVGITSVGRECGLPNSPGVYTRISSYIPWLESVIWR